MRMVLHGLAFVYCDVYADGIVNMNAWKYIRAGIHSVNKSDQPGTDIFIRINGGTEIDAVWNQGADKQAKGHSHKKEDTKPVVIFFVCKKEVEDSSCDI